MAKSKTVVAKVDFIPRKGLGVQFVKKDTRFASNHPVVKAFPSMFADVDELPRVERATAGPGERRNVTIPSG